MNGLSLYALNEECMELVAEIEAATADENDALVAELEEKLGELAPAIDKKRESYIHVIRSSQAHAKGLREESRRFAERAKQMENLAKRLTDVIHEDMVDNGETRATAGMFQLRVANSPQRVQITVPVEDLPEMVQQVSYSADMGLLRDILKGGAEIEGAELVQGTHLRIR